MLKEEVRSQDLLGIKKLGIAAGYGELPLLMAESAQRQGIEVVIGALNKETYELCKNKFQTVLSSPVEILSLLDYANEQGIEHLSFIGKVPKMDFFKNIHKLDSRLLKKLETELQNFNDDSLHFKILDFLENERGFKVVDQTLFLREYFPDEKIFTKRQPTAEELEEAVYGLKMAKSIGELDIGQTVVVQNKSIIAVEAIEGTDKCIKRAIKSLGWLNPNKSVTVCKASKPAQDKRFDVPAVGLQTLKSMTAGSILAFEANETFFLNYQAAIDYANSRDICILAKRI